MKSILIVTEQFTMGGLETHIQGEISQLAKAGWEIHLAVGKNFSSEFLPEYISSVTNGLPIELTNTTADLVDTVEELRKIIRDKSINYVHAHPFLSIIPAIISAELEGIPFALTLHGPASLASYGPIYDFLFKDVVLPATDLLVAISPEVKRYASIYTPEQSIAYIPNAVKFTDIRDVKEIDTKKELGWLVVSRLDELKIIGILDFIIKAKQAGISRVVIVGDGPAKESLNQDIISKGLSNYVHFHGTSTDVYSLMQRSSGVAGMGRVALEGLACKKPVVLVGYDGVKGILNQYLFELAIDSNFSGRGLPTIDELTFTQQVENIAIGEILSLYDFAESRFNEDHVWQLFENHLVAMQPRTPGLLTNFYYSIRNDLIEDLRPYLHSSKVLEHLGDLVISSKYFTPRLSNAYVLYKQRFIDLSVNQSLVEKNAQIASLTRAVSDRDIQVASLTQAVADQNMQIATLNQKIFQQNNQIQMFQTSRSWRLTRPLRLVYSLSRYIWSKDGRYLLLKAIYWKLPQALQDKLKKQRYAFAAKRMQRNMDIASDKFLNDDTNDYIEWVEKANKNNKVVIIPCGFEFDELVNQRPINAAKYFAEKGYQVLFIAWQWSVKDKLSKGCKEVFPNVFQVPLFDFIKYVNKLHLCRERSLFLVTMPTPNLVGLVPILREKGFAIIYDIMDEWEAFCEVGQAPWFKKSVEESLILQSDFVCAVSPPLRNKFSHIRSDIKIIGNGFTPEVLGVENQGIARNREDGGPIIGYFGHLTDAWFDWKLILQLAKSHPHIKFEIIGYGEPEWVRKEITALSNIHLLGKVLPKDLHRQVSNWSIGIIPFVEGILAEAVDPIKIYEYLYFGLPVVVTGIRHLKSYPMTYFAESEDVEDIIEKALNDHYDTEDINNFLQQVTWRARFETLINEINKNNGIWDLYAN